MVNNMYQVGKFDKYVSILTRKTLLLLILSEHGAIPVQSRRKVFGVNLLWRAINNAKSFDLPSFAFTGSSRGNVNKVNKYLNKL